MKQAIFDWIDSQGYESASAVLETSVERLKTWKEGSQRPTFKAASLFYDRVLNQNGNSHPKTFEKPEYDKLDSLWEGKDLMVLFPCYKTTNPVTAFTLVALALDLGKEKVRFEKEIGDAMIYNSRNKLASRFLESGCTWSLWIDDDIIAPIGRASWYKKWARMPSDYPDQVAGRHVVDRLMSHKKKIVGGTYFGRNFEGPPMFSEALTSLEANRAARYHKDELRLTEWVATGCLLVHRDVYLDIQKTHPYLAPGIKRSLPQINEMTGELEYGELTRKEWGFFDPKPGRGEDVCFCKRAKDAGHEVYVDTGLQCGHVGNCVWGSHNTKKPDADL